MFSEIAAEWHQVKHLYSTVQRLMLENPFSMCDSFLLFAFNYFDCHS